MPFIKSKVSCKVSLEKESELKVRLGQAIEIIPGKSEQYLLLEFEDNCHLWLRGKNDKPIAYIEAAIFGNEDHRQFSNFSASVTKIYNKVLNIPVENIHIKFEDIVSWSVGGQFIDRRVFR